MGVVSGVGYHDRLRWSIFSPSTGKAHHGNIGNAPTSEGLAADGYGLSFSPFWNPTETELTYCLKLADWWRAVQEKRQKEMGHVYQIGSGDWTENLGRPHRQHRLISEAGPDVPPNGFFDCTAEVCMNDFVVVHISTSLPFRFCTDTSTTTRFIVST
jgi:hypothetical protein